MSQRRLGFTLVELLLVVVLGSIVLGATLRILITNQRIFTASSATINGQQTTRMASEIMFGELREVSPTGGDILAMETTSLTVRVMRKFSIVCEPWDRSGTAADFVVLDTLPGGLPVMAGSNVFADDDSVHVYADNDPNDDADDVWLPARIDQVGTDTCPNGEAGRRLRFDSPQHDRFLTDSVGVGAPIRSFGEYTFTTVTYDGEPFLGRIEGTDTIPFAGPLRATDGLEFIYRDGSGTVTAVAADVRQVEIKLRTGSEVLNSLGGFVTDSIDLWVYTRN